MIYQKNNELYYSKTGIPLSTDQKILYKNLINNVIDPKEYSFFYDNIKCNKSIKQLPSKDAESVSLYASDKLIAGGGSDIRTVNKLEDYLYTITFDKWDINIGEKYAEKGYMLLLKGACSSVRYGNFCGRHFDWFYDECVTYAIRCNGYDNKLSSIGVAGTVPELTKQIMDAGKAPEIFKALPAITLDGVNEAGVYCNTNVVPAGDKGFTIGTNPGKPNLGQLCTIRFLLDYAESAVNGIKLLNNYNIWAPLKMGEECHIMIADAIGTYVVEFVNNEMHVLSDVEGDGFDMLPIYNNKPATLMTNFYLTDYTGGKTKAVFHGDDEAAVIATGLTPHAMGLERYDTLLDLYTAVDSVEKMKTVMDLVRYTKGYDRTTNPYWYSELTANYGDKSAYGDMTIYRSATDFDPIVDKYIDMYEHRVRTRDASIYGSRTWQTVHQSIYDIDNKELTLYVQEGETPHIFTL